MAKLTLQDFSSGYALVSVLNANNTLIEAAIENTLSRDGTAPNQMDTTLDMNSNRIVNVGNAVGAQDVVTLADLTAAQIAASGPFGGLSDVDLTGVVANDLLFFNGVDWVDTAGALTFDGTD
jgi:hypothetical protein